jgi:hypothetical protein
MTETSFDSGAGASREKLEEAQEILLRQLEEACRVTEDGGAPETTGELRKLDDALLAAARTTEEMLAMRGERKAARAATLVDVPAAVERIREFMDSERVRWRVWAVTPGQAISTSPRNLGDLQHGWLAFESLDSGAKRRLASFPTDWATMSDGDLEGLLRSAAPARKRGGGEASPAD